MDTKALVYGLFVWITYCVSALNDRPVIGILTQESQPDFVHYGDTYLELPYVTYMEMAGARVLPIRMKESLSYYRNLFGYINGVLFPGGGQNLTTSEYAKTAKIFFDLAMQANAAGDYFPVWGTCLGFEMLAVLTGGHHVLSTCGLWDVSLPLKPLPGSRQSRLLSSMPDELYKILVKDNVTANFHRKCLTVKNFTSNADLRSFYRPISVNQGSDGNVFISTFEGYKYPIYGTQWHPEKNPLFWDSRYHVNHSLEGVRISQYMANFFVQEARRSDHHFPDALTEAKLLINNDPTVFLGPPRFLSNYYFNFSNHHQSHPKPHHTVHRSLCISTHASVLAPEENSTSSSSHAEMSPERILEEEHIYIILSLGMVACLIVGIQVGRCLEAHSQSDTWPDVLQWALHNSRHRGDSRHSAKRRNSKSGQRVRLLQHDKHYFTFEESTETEEL